MYGKVPKKTVFMKFCFTSVFRLTKSRYMQNFIAKDEEMKELQGCDIRMDGHDEIIRVPSFYKTAWKLKSIGYHKLLPALFISNLFLSPINSSRSPDAIF